MAQHDETRPDGESSENFGLCMRLFLSLSDRYLESLSAGLDAIEKNVQQALALQEKLVKTGK